MTGFSCQHTNIHWALSWDCRHWSNSLPQLDFKPLEEKPCPYISRPIAHNLLLQEVFVHLCMYHRLALCLVSHITVQKPKVFWAYWLVWPWMLILEFVQHSLFLWGYFPGGQTVLDHSAEGSWSMLAALQADDGAPLCDRTCNLLSPSQQFSSPHTACSALIHTSYWFRTSQKHYVCKKPKSSPLITDSACLII